MSDAPDAHGLGDDWAAIVVCGLPYAQSPPFADTHLAQALADNRQVLVVDRPIPLQSQLRHRPPIVRTEHERLRVIRPVVGPMSERPPSLGITDRLVGYQVQAAARSLGHTPRVVITLGTLRGTLPQVTRDRLVYWQRDLPTEPRYSPSPVDTARRHKALIDSADLVTGVSAGLVEGLDLPAERCAVIANGADVDHFGTPAVPLGARDRALLGSGPVLGFVGAVSWRLDRALIEHLARRQPSWTIVLVGTVEGPPPCGGNIVRIGPKSYDDLPSWVQRFDVGIVPYLDNAFNRASFPLKVFDYLSAGVPVVSTHLPPLEGLEPVVRLGRGATDFEAAVHSVLAAPPSEAACRAVAAANSWASRVARLELLVAGLTPRVDAGQAWRRSGKRRGAPPLGRTTRR